MKVFLKTLPFLFLAFLYSCQHIEYKKLNEFEETPDLVVAECLKANPKLTASDCDIKKCFSDSFTLHGIIEITEDIVEILEELNINYRVNSATLLGALRFKAPLPWDDDSDLDVIDSDFTSQLSVVRNKVVAKGYQMEPLKMHMFSKENSFWQITYTEAKYKALLSKVQKDIKPLEMDRLWKSYQNGDYVPHLDIFPLGEDGDRFFLNNPWFYHQGYTRSECYNRQKYQFLDKNYAGPANAGEVYKSWYGGGEVVRDFVVQPPHRASCPSPRFKDIRKSPETFKYMVKYLKYVYGDKYQGAEMP